MKSSHVWSVDAQRFDEPNLVSCAGLVPVLALALALAEQTGLEPLLARVRFKTSKVKSGGVNPAGKLGCVIAGMWPARTSLLHRWEADEISVSYTVVHRESPGPRRLR